MTYQWLERNSRRRSYSMAKKQQDPAMLFYPADFMVGTQLFNFEERGAYIYLICLQFFRGRLRKEEIKKALGADYERLWAVLSEKYKTDGELFWNERVEIEREKRSRFTDSRRKNLQGSSHMESHMDSHMENENVNEDINVKGNVIVNNIFDHWNKAGIIKHQKLTGKMETKIKSALKDYTPEELAQAISNYSEILNSPEYYWSYRWTIQDFLMRGIEKFSDLQTAKKNYRKENLENNGRQRNRVSQSELETEYSSFFTKEGEETKVK